MSLRIRLIQYVIDLNEKLIFYPRLRRYYKEAIQLSQPVIFDIGANKGQSIRFFLELYPGAVIFAFEPNPRLFQRLQNEFKHLPRVKILNKGVSNQNGRQVLNETVTEETSTFEQLNYESGYLQMKARVLGIKPAEVIRASYEVDVIKLSDFIVSEGIKSIDVIKIDTEGHELKCLEGLFDNLEARVEYIQLEQHFDDMYVNAPDTAIIEQLLLNKGFTRKAEIKHGFGNFNELVFKRN